MLPENFPSKDLLEKEGYDTIEDVSGAPDEELLAIDGIGPVKLDEIRNVAPFVKSPEESGSGATSGKLSEPSAQSFQTQTSKLANDQTDPVTGQSLPDGITKNERGTLTASSTVSQDDMVSPEKVVADRKARLRRAGEKLAAALES